MRQGSCFKSVELTRLNLILLIPTALGSLCLPDVVAAGQRQNLVNAPKKRHIPKDLYLEHGTLHKVPPKRPKGFKGLALPLTY